MRRVALATNWVGLADAISSLLCQKRTAVTVVAVAIDNGRGEKDKNGVGQIYSQGRIATQQETGQDRKKVRLITDRVDPVENVEADQCENCRNGMNDEMAGEKEAK